MKKTNRIENKGAIGTQQAQAKHHAKAMPRLDAADHGEYLTSIEPDTHGEQTLYRRGKVYTLVTAYNQVREGRLWRTWAEWSNRHPGSNPWDLPPGRVKRIATTAEVTREEVVAWLWENFCFVVIPPEFREDFRPCREGIDWEKIIALEGAIDSTEAAYGERRESRMSRKALGPVPPRPLADWPRHRKNFIIGWRVIASTDAGTLARCSVGFVLRTDRVDARGEKQWPCHQQMLTAREARAWLLENVLAVAFPPPRRTSP